MKNILIFGFLLMFTGTAFGAYHHAANTDSDVVLEVYPEIAGTKLDSCALCHSGGEYEKKPGVFISMGSCQWCHYTYGYDESGQIEDTLNGYGRDYLQHGRNGDALGLIAGTDSDLDGYKNQDEIAALRYPGNDGDDPTKVAAPYQVISLADLENMEYHRQIMLMNTHKSGDFYAEYGGVAMSDILDYSGILPDATGITVYAPDGWAQYHPLEEESDPLMYHVYGEYPSATYYYSEQADTAINLTSGWCDYSAVALEGLSHGDDILVEDGLKMLLAFVRDEEYLDAGTLTEDNKLDGEGPFRVVPPQKEVGPPDQSVNSLIQKVEWPFDDNADHNAGFASRSATIIRVEPLPEGTTDIDILEAGWNYVDEKKIVVYGAIDPFYTVLEKLVTLKQLIRSMERCDFKKPSVKRKILRNIDHVEKMLKKGNNKAFSQQLSRLMNRVDGCTTSQYPDRNDWIASCESQESVYWTLHEVKVLMGGN